MAFELFSVQRALSSLHINQIGDAGVVGLAEGLKSNTVLQQLQYG